MAQITRAARLTSAIGAAVLVTLGAAGVVNAHADLESTTPVDGSTVEVPVSQITFTFTELVMVTGAGFEVLDPQGQLRVPEVATDDDMSFVLRVDPPLAGGTAAVRYEVTAADGHVIEGSLTFVIAASATPGTGPPPVPVAETEASVAVPTIPAATDESDAPTGSIVMIGAVAVAIVAIGFLFVRARSAPRR